MDDSERQALAREVAADDMRGSRWIEVFCSECDHEFEVESPVSRLTFLEGWDAAIAYMEKRNGQA